jgi:HEAT repeat protein
MRWVDGLEARILELLKSGNPEIEYEAVLAAGAWTVKEAWPHVHGLLAEETTERTLLLAAIEATGTIGGEEAEEILVELADSDDPEIAEVADDALVMLSNAQAEEDEDSPHF